MVKTEYEPLFAAVRLLEVIKIAARTSTAAVLQLRPTAESQLTVVADRMTKVTKMAARLGRRRTADTSIRRKYEAGRAGSGALTNSGK